MSDIRFEEMLINNLKEENKELKQQLALKEHTITNLVEDNRASQEWYKKQLAEKEKENELMAKTLKMTKFIAKEVTQDKISFAVEQLEKVKEFFRLCLLDKMFGEEKLEDYIDNQIKELKEME